MEWVCKIIEKCKRFGWKIFCVSWSLVDDPQKSAKNAEKMVDTFS